MAKKRRVSLGYLVEICRFWGRLLIDCIGELLVMVMMILMGNDVVLEYFNFFRLIMLFVVFLI